MLLFSESIPSAFDRIHIICRAVSKNAQQSHATNCFLKQAERKLRTWSYITELSCMLARFHIGKSVREVFLCSLQNFIPFIHLAYEKLTMHQKNSPHERSLYTLQYYTV